MSELILQRSVGVHDGNFHADEVVACALLAVFGLIDCDKIIRSRDPKTLSTCEYICDVGGIYAPEQKRFDHHQADYTGPYSSAGMVLTYLFDTQQITKDLRDYLYEHLIYGVDKHDVGITTPYGFANFSHVISLFNPVSYSAKPEEIQQAFLEAFDFASTHLKRLIERYEYNESSKELIAEAMKSKSAYIVIEKAVPWVENFFALGGKEHPAKFLLMPTSEGQWKVRAIPPDGKKRMQMRAPLPEAWAGLMDSELEKASNIPGAVFCHRGRFVSIWKTRKAAEKALEKALEECAHDTV